MVEIIDHLPDNMWPMAHIESVEAFKGIYFFWCYKGQDGKLRASCKTKINPRWFPWFWKLVFKIRIFLFKITHRHYI